ncbi:hypothetical protein TSUD_34790 [Trifolium subterraneum]|uniref:DUF3511 domain-containing protein n=1 Tax=Trifolium subterraneum TaxID=3900 RepID=A0A2Z6LS36_TRISU|nr:hypothetical protein TSUD_34790 [Trifolium subterraneum]
MEAIGHGQTRSLYGDTNLYDHRDGRVGTLYEKEMTVVRTRDKNSRYCSYYEPPPPPRKWGGEITKKPSPSSSWWNDREMKRKRRVAAYKLFAAQGKVKYSLQKGFHNFKKTCKKIVT